MKRNLVACLLLVSAAIAFAQASAPSGEAGSAAAADSPMAEDPAGAESSFVDDFLLAGGIEFGFGFRLEGYSRHTIEPFIGYKEYASEYAPQASFSLMAQTRYLRVAILYELGWKGHVFARRDYPTWSSYPEWRISRNCSWIAFEGNAMLPFGLFGLEWYGLVGIDFALNLTCVDNLGNDLRSGAPQSFVDSLNRLWLLIGLGSRFELGQGLAMEYELVLGYKVPSYADIWFFGAKAGNVVADLGMDLGAFVVYRP